MNCAGCDQPIDQPVAYAVMNKSDMAAAGITPALDGMGNFAAAPVCVDCFVNPEHRNKVLKAHYAMPNDVGPMVGNAGASSIG